MNFSRAVSDQLPFQVDTPPSYLSLSLSEEIDGNIDELFQMIESDEEPAERLPFYHFINTLSFSNSEIDIIEDNPFRIDVFYNEEYEEIEDADDEDDESSDCPICFEKCEIKNVCILQCNKAHRYCCDCLVQQLEKTMSAYQENPRQLQNICPKCALCREIIQNITCYSTESDENIKNVLI